MKRFFRLTAFLLAICLLPVAATAEEKVLDERGWVDFFLICNEGMNNSGGNEGSTMMVVSMNPKTGKIRLMMITWDTFINYPGYDLPQKIDVPYRNNGAEETMKVFNLNFDMDIKLYMSLNYLNLASLIDDYGGVTVDVSRAERNSLNEKVNGKKETLINSAQLGLLTQLYIENLAQDYYLNDYGPETKLKGLQAVAYGWLQYDSVYNCCLRDVKVIASLFGSVGKTIGQKAALYTEEYGPPENLEGRRAINLDAMTEDDIAFLRQEMAPIFQKAEHNLSEQNIRDISLALALGAYNGSRQGVNVFDSLEYRIMPLEAKDPYDSVAGTEGHLVDYRKNSEAMKEFLFAEE